MKDERHEQSVTDCNHLGNAAKMREALSRILGIATPDFDANEIVDYILHGDAVKKEGK